MTISKRAQQFQEALRENGLHFQVVELPQSTRTADDAATTLGCGIGQIVKSLVFRNTKTGKPVLVLTSGANRVDERKIAKLLGCKIDKADALFVKENTGYAIGGVPPLYHKTVGDVIVDEDLLKFDEVWAAAGTSNAVFKITGNISNILPAHIVTSVS